MLTSPLMWWMLAALILSSAIRCYLYKPDVHNDWEIHIWFIKGLQMKAGR